MDEKHCPTCGVEQWVEQPPCAEHDDCREWICVECSMAFFDGWVSVPVEEPVSAATA